MFTLLGKKELTIKTLREFVSAKESNLIDLLRGKQRRGVVLVVTQLEVRLVGSMTLIQVRNIVELLRVLGRRVLKWNLFSLHTHIV